uniref:Zinc finger Ran-binding domain-containing protein 2 n=1 Tax=Theileria parva TaxID=5875 RepID=Q4N3S5_THEPA|eukprot:XP_765481.1 hypothetical protein [Theileria parva strain Muguga]
MDRREGDWLCPDTSSVFQPRFLSKARRLDLQQVFFYFFNLIQRCGNLNWAKRTHCNICNISRALQEPEDRLGRGGGYFDLFDPRDRKEHDSEDEEYDEFGRKKKKSLKNKDQ